jgi:hypothetical protein
MKNDSTWLKIKGIFFYISLACNSICLIIVSAVCKIVPSLGVALHMVLKLHRDYTSENQNTEFFKCDLFWRIAIYHNSELILVHLKTDKSHTFIMYLVIFCVSLSLRELSELRGVRLLKSIFKKNLEWNP